MMKLRFTTYLILIAWFAALAALGWLMYSSTAGTRAEFWRLVAARPAIEMVTAALAAQ